MDDERALTTEARQGAERHRPTRGAAEAAVDTLIRWAGDDPSRESLRDTPQRVVRAYEEFFSGYGEDPRQLLSRTFEEVADYQGIVLLRDIRLESHCEHHIVPIIGTAHVAYLPDRRVVGISKLVRVVHVLARRLQTQETLTAQIAQVLDEALAPRGVGVSTVTSHFTGDFASDTALQDRLWRLL